MIYIPFLNQEFKIGTCFLILFFFNENGSTVTNTSQLFMCYYEVIDPYVWKNFFLICLYILFKCKNLVVLFRARIKDFILLTNELAKFKSYFSKSLAKLSQRHGCCMIPTLGVHFFISLNLISNIGMCFQNGRHFL